MEATILSEQGGGNCWIVAFRDEGGSYTLTARSRKATSFPAWRSISLDVS